MSLTMDHPNIVRVQDVYETGDEVHIVMECLTGGELFSKIQQKGAFTERDAAKTMAQMLRAVGYLHARHIVHRDLKPENFLYEHVGDDAALKLIDFGLGTTCNSTDSMQACCGTIGYLSPEVLSKRGYTSKCDMWSLGVIAFKLLTGHAPFNGHGNVKLVRKKIEAGIDWDCEKLSRLKTVSEEAIDFTMQLLQHEPSNRMCPKTAIFHPWLIREAASSPVRAAPEPRAVLSLSSYARRPPLARAALQLLAQRSLKGKDVACIQGLFVNLDMDNEGAVSVRDLKDAVLHATGKLIASGGEASSVPLSELFEALDDIWEDRVSYSEFLAAASAEQIEPSECAVRDIFRRFDVDSSGYISMDDVHHVFGKGFEGESVQDLMGNVCSGETDGGLSFQEFYRELRSERLE